MSLTKKIFKDIIFWILLITYLFSFYFFNQTGLFFLKIVGSLSIGGLVGYLTNILAIWMLFNPKRKFLGIQGVIPKKRDEIAKSFSAVIEEEFINPSSIRNFIEKNSDILVDSLDSFFEKYEEIKIPPVKDIVGKSYTNIIENMSETIISKMKDINFDNVNFLKDYIKNSLHIVIWDKIKDKSFEDIGINLSDIIMTNIIKILNDENNIKLIKEKVSETVVKKVKIPFIPIENIISGLVNNFLSDIVRDFNEKDKLYIETEKFINSHVSTLKFKEIMTQEQFEKIIQNFSEKINISNIINYLSQTEESNLKKIISNILEKIFNVEINLTKILSNFSVDLKSILSFLINKYKFKIINMLEQFLNKISFSEIIKEKIESYSIEEMEEVTLKVAKRELRYVEIFGIPLGMLISLFQIII